MSVAPFWLNLHGKLIIKNMTNINKYFNKIFKKRDLSGESNPEEDRRKAREGSSITSNNDALEDEVFQQVSTTNYISEVWKYLKVLENWKYQRL